jgi:glycosyltransferase involved in cell wall biosynthesis
MSTVIHVVQHLKPGGIETMALDLIDFKAKNERTFIISLEGNKENAIKQWPRLKVYQKDIIFLNKQHGISPLLLIKMAVLLKNLNADIVHTHHIGPLLYGGLAAKLLRINCLIHTEHDAWHLNDSHRRKLQKTLLKLVQPVLVADAQSVADTIRRQLKIESVKVIPNGIDTARFIPGDKIKARQALQLPPHIKLIGCSGRLEFVKGQHILIEALHGLPNDVHLALAGSGTMEANLQLQASQLKLNDRIHFLGRIDNMPTFYQSLDIFCLPSLNEGFPLSPLEAQSCGIPSLVTDVGGSRETLCVECSEYVPADNATSMTKSLFKMLNKHYLTSPRHFILSHGDVRSMADRYAELRQIGVAHV